MLGLQLNHVSERGPRYHTGCPKGYAHFWRFVVRCCVSHDDVIKWKHFPRYWPVVWPVNSLHKGQGRGALMFSLICASINGWVHNREAGDLRRHRAHYDVTVMFWYWSIKSISFKRLSQFKWTPWWKCVNELCNSNANNYLKQYWLIIGKVPMTFIWGTFLNRDPSNQSMKIT